MRLSRLFLCFFLLFLTPHARADAPTATTLPNGMRLLVKREPDAPLIAVQVFVRVGVGQEMARETGESQFVARTLLLSTTTRPPSAMTSDIGALGGNVGATWTPDWTQINALTLPDRLHQTIEFLMDVLQNADFDAEGVEDARQAILGERENADADLFQVAYAAAREKLYAGSAYATPGIGTTASLKRLDRADLQRFFERYYTPKNTTVVIVGNVETSDARTEIETATSDFSPARLARHADAPASAPPAILQATPPIQTTLPGSTQVAALISERIAPPSDADYPALLVVNALLGGMKSSRLFTNIRDTQGMAYDLASVITSQQTAADLTAYAFAAPTRAGKKTTSADAKKEKEPAVETLRAAMQQQFDSMKTMPPTGPELARAQHFLVGSYKIKHERIEDRATLLGTAEMLRGDGGKFDTDYAQFINAVTLADIQRVTTQYFVHPIVTLVGTSNTP